MKASFLLFCLLFQGITSELFIDLSQCGDVPVKNKLVQVGTTNCSDQRLDFSEVAEKLLQLDLDRNVIAINARKKCWSTAADPYREPLLLSYYSELMHKNTTKELIKLLDMGQTALGHQDAFLTAIVNTKVMHCLGDYLWAKGLITRNLWDVLDEYWFTEYQRGYKMSSGFEHVFVGELKLGYIKGLHNWEGLKKKGYPFCFTKVVRLDQKGYVVEARLQRGNQIKTFFVETTPELEMAFYTLCFSFRTFDKRHECFFNFRNFYIRTFKHNLGYTEVIEASYPIVL
ncbi:endoribonuclease CG2145-like [Macrobrachium nipponense]|uniref:endoribonuclease CG2145-like n=1 Tax=Macrobrachium nipponense TaxID=159736 RepID=UPI0030C885B2